MFMELLFGVIFFILPILGMFITIIAAKLKERNHMGNKQVQKQPVFWDMPIGIVQRDEPVPKRFFEDEARGYIHSFCQVDTS